MLISIVGQFDQNLKNLSKLTDTNLFFRGNSIMCKGNAENILVFCTAIKFLINKYLLTNIIENKEEYLDKKKKMRNFSYQNTWNNINQKIITTINEN